MDQIYGAYWKLRTQGLPISFFGIELAGYRSRSGRTHLASMREGTTQCGMAAMHMTPAMVAVGEQLEGCRRCALPAELAHAVRVWLPLVERLERYRFETMECEADMRHRPRKLKPVEAARLAGRIRDDIVVATAASLHTVDVDLSIAWLARANAHLTRVEEVLDALERQSGQRL